MKNYLCICIWQTCDGAFSISRSIETIDSKDKVAIVDYMRKEAGFEDMGAQVDEDVYDILLIKNGNDGIPEVFKTFQPEVDY